MFCGTWLIRLRKDSEWQLLQDGGNEAFQVLLGVSTAVFLVMLVALKMGPLLGVTLKGVAHGESLQVFPWYLWLFRGSGGFPPLGKHCWGLVIAIYGQMSWKGEVPCSAWNRFACLLESCIMLDESSTERVPLLLDQHMFWHMLTMADMVTLLWHWHFLLHNVAHDLLLLTRNIARIWFATVIWKMLGKPG